MEVADTLFDSSLQVKQLLTKLLRNRCRPEDRSSVKEYLKVLEQLQVIAASLDISIDGYSDRMSQMNYLLTEADTNEEILSGAAICLEMLNELLEKTMLYRKKYCIIGRNDYVPGLGSHFITNLGQIVESIHDGYIPVIDMVHPETCFKGLSSSKKMNAWEIFFEQPYGIGIQDIPGESERIHKEGIPSIMPNYDMEFLTNKEKVQVWRDKCHKYMKPSAYIKENVSQVESELDWKNKRIIGVLCRGTDYVSVKPYNHPVQPDIDEVIVKTEKVMKAKDCDYCYLATEDMGIKKVFEEHFKKRLLTSQEFYYKNKADEMLTELYEKGICDIYSKNVEYLTALLLLSDCQCFIGGRTSGTVASLLMADSYEYFYVWNKGRYGIDDKSMLLGL